MARRSRRRGEAAARHADTIRFALFEARPAGLHFAQLAHASALSPAQTRSGLAALRDQIADKDWPPLTWTRADGYRLGADKAELHAYEYGVIKQKLTEFRRLITGTVAPHARAYPGDRWIKHLIAQVTAVESTLELITQFE